MKNDEIKPYCVKQMNNKVEGGPGKGRWGGVVVLKPEGDNVVVVRIRGGEIKCRGWFEGQYNY